jgi:20S proteasome subunit beta 2
VRILTTRERDEADMTLRVATSTGTTIVGLKFGGGDSGEEEGICLGADTRATGGPIVADKNCEKVSKI